MKRIFFTVINDLTYDQRMHRICTSLANNGYAVTLIGRHLPTSVPLQEKLYNQKRISCIVNKGKLFYAEYNLRLFLYCLFKKLDAICAIDLDTIIPCYYISKFKNIVRTYDAHELFTEQKEIVTRPRIYKWWKKIERKYLPKFSHGYTVSKSIADIYHKEYGVNYALVRNIPILQEGKIQNTNTRKFILYQGAVNEARGLEALIPAMRQITLPLVICGDGNFMPQLKQLISKFDVTEKVELRGMVNPDELSQITQNAYIGLNLVENIGLNQYYSLANKFFDYIHAEVPQVSMNFPEYKYINDDAPVALLIDQTDAEKIATAINKLASDTVLYQQLKNNCGSQKKKLNWQYEEKTLLTFYDTLFNK